MQIAPVTDPRATFMCIVFITLANLLGVMGTLLTGLLVAAGRRQFSIKPRAGAPQPTVLAQAARSKSTIKSRVIGTASRLVDSSN
jgi:hypothetical protein